MDRLLEMTIKEQMSNLGAEINRLIAFRNKNNIDLYYNFTIKVIEMIGRMKMDDRHSKHFEELNNLEVAILDHFINDNKLYDITDEQILNVCFDFLQ